MDGYNEWMNRALALEAQNDLLKKEVELLSKSNFDMVKEFHNTFAKTKDPEKPTKPSPEVTHRRMKLMCEELQEVLRELGYEVFFDIKVNENASSPNLAKIGKELSDLLYVTYGSGAELGLPLDDMFEAVHKSNMSKLGENGKPIYREDGKVLKGPNYYEPDIERLIDDLE